MSSEWPTARPDYEDLDACVLGEMGRWTVPGIAAGVWQDGHVETLGHGVASLHTRQPVTGDTAHAIGAIERLHAADAVDGLLLVPDGGSTTFHRLVDDAMPELRRLGIASDHAPGATFRDRLGLVRPPNRYSAAAGVTR